MAYSEYTDLIESCPEATLIQLTDDAGIGTVDAGKVTRAIADADALIDSFCNATYSVPFETVPNIVRSWSVVIAIYKLYGRRKGAPKTRMGEYDTVMTLMQKVQTGSISIEGASLATGIIQTNLDEEDRTFTVGKESLGTDGTLDDF